MSKFLVYLLVCLSLHACSARSLATTIDEENRIQLFAKDVTFLTRDTFKTEGRITSENNGSGSRDDAKLMWKKRSNVSRKEDGEEIKGNKVMTIQEGAQVKTLWRQSRFILETPPSAQHEEEAVNSIEKDPVEDVVVMDYAQPHRKPPIHNTKH
ncbi:uncharacterized protein [Nicotiana tomentosiformis]|uniref:uncharacterized protein n=1 Tax=Nicotiana tomentosiformis TaxID=4098 RepID=UPI00051C7EB9|nr:uncharacterized protein LOC104101041 isoform X1 [Nicotiana tomentosiformis]